MKYIFALIALTVFLAGCDSTECPQEELYLDHYEYMELIDGSVIARPVYYCGGTDQEHAPETSPVKIRYQLPRY